METRQRQATWKDVPHMFRRATGLSPRGVFSFKVRKTLSRRRIHATFNLVSPGSVRPGFPQLQKSTALLHPTQRPTKLFPV